VANEGARPNERWTVLEFGQIRRQTDKLATAKIGERAPDEAR